ncbi:hypothetical protein Ahy_A02g008712 [Arachis hypogaea]|uniref:Transposase MuDR plant domain-containing protein n=1 Tax=Arachis hypogaea TaxID=3818 RepID=A0A445EFQ0_ARAHY|nr:hypothetical protein Ahy_A02g008712 [Arachis hypogaea]
MVSNNPFIVVLLYPNYRMKNDDNGVTFVCQGPILFRTQRVETLSDLKSLKLSKFGGTQARKIGRVAYRLLAPMGNGVFQFQLFRLHRRLACATDVRHSWEDHNDRPLAPPPIHVAILEHEVEEGEEESDEDYVADNADSKSSNGGDEDEFVPETPVGAVPRHVLLPPHPILALSAVPSHYHSLDLDTMHERIPIYDTCGVDYNLDGGVEFQIGHRFRSQEAVLQGVKNYSIHRSAEYRMIESDWLKYHVQCRQANSGCQWSLRVALRQNLGYWEVRRFGGPHSYLAPTMSQDHRQLDSSLIYRVILPLIQSNPSISIPVLQGVVQTSYHFKPSYRKALQSCVPDTICDLHVKPYYEGHLIVRDCCMFDKVFWTFLSCVEAFKHYKPFVFVDDTHLYDKYGEVLLITVAQDRNNNILPIAFAIVESEIIESWSFFLINLRRHVTPQDGLLVISDISQAIKAALSSDDSLHDYPNNGNILKFNNHNETNFEVGRPGIMCRLVQPVDVPVIPRLARHYRFGQGYSQKGLKEGKKMLTKLN